MTDDHGWSSGEILEEAQKRRKGSVIDVEEDSVKIVIFKLGEELFAVNGGNVLEILPLSKIYFVPGCPEHILGLINVRGDVESVVSICGFIGLPLSVVGETSKIALMSGGGVRTGVIVDSLLDVLDIAVSSIKNTISTIEDNKKGLVAGEFFYSGKTVTLLEAGNLLKRLL